MTKPKPKPFILSADNTEAHMTWPQYFDTLAVGLSAGFTVGLICGALLLIWIIA